MVQLHFIEVLHAKLSEAKSSDAFDESESVRVVGLLQGLLAKFGELHFGFLMRLLVWGHLVCCFIGLFVVVLALVFDELNLLTGLGLLLVDLELAVDVEDELLDA